MNFSLVHSNTMNANTIMDAKYDARKNNGWHFSLQIFTSFQSVLSRGLRKKMGLRKFYFFLATFYLFFERNFAVSFEPFKSRSLRLLLII